MDEDEITAAAIGVDDRIARRLRQRRETLGLSEAEAAERIGITRAKLARIENGRSHPTTVLLGRICTALGLTMTAVMTPDGPAADAAAAGDGAADHGAGPPTRERNAVLRRIDQPVWNDPGTGYRRRVLSPPGTGSAVEMVEIEFPPYADVTYGPTGAFGTTQHLVVLEGALTVTVGGNTHHLDAGDCLHMCLGGGGTVHNPGPAPCRYLVVLERPR